MTGWSDPGNDDPAGYRECLACQAVNAHRPVGCGPWCINEEVEQ